MDIRFLAMAILLGLAACSPEPAPAPNPPPTTGPIPDTGVGLSQTACFGTCPVYSITVYPNEFYQLESGRFTRNPDTSTTGTLPAGSWAAANAALQTAKFTNLPTEVTRGSPACGDRLVSDLPSATISETTIAGLRTVEYYAGCLNAADKPALDQLVSDLRTALQVDDLVTP